MPLPQFNLQNGQVLNGPIVHGQPFNWYNPTGNPVMLTNCGTFCTQDSYTVPAYGTTQATMLAMPNPNPFAFTDPAWNTPGQPHLSNPSRPELHDEDEGEDVEKDVA